MKKKLDTRFPASRIKKIMQADEDIGKIAQAVPLLVSKSLELFLQDLCDRTYEITLQRGAKTVSASHLKQCIHRYNVFDFLREIVNKVPDIGGSDSAGGGEERNGVRRRKTFDADDNESEEDDTKRMRMAAQHGSGRGRGRGRARGRGSRGSTSSKNNMGLEKYEDEDLELSPERSDKQEEALDRCSDVNILYKESKPTSIKKSAVVRDFDLNMEWEESDVGSVQTTFRQENASNDRKRFHSVVNKQDSVQREEQLASWETQHDLNADNASLMQFHVPSDRTIDQDEDDYDNEDG